MTKPGNAVACGFQHIFYNMGVSSVSTTREMMRRCTEIFHIQMLKEKRRSRGTGPTKHNKKKDFFRNTETELDGE